jgi:amidase
MGPAGGDRTTVEFAALLTGVLGGYRPPPRYQTSELTTTTKGAPRE